MARKAQAITKLTYHNDREIIWTAAETAAESARGEQTERKRACEQETDMQYKKTNTWEKGKSANKEVADRESLCGKIEKQ